MLDWGTSATVSRHLTVIMRSPSLNRMVGQNDKITLLGKGVVKGGDPKSNLLRTDSDQVSDF